jgi:hypothetical protein
MGFQGKFYVGPKGCTSHTAVGMVLAENVRNPSYSYSFSDVDATTRRHMGTKAYAKGMLDVEITFTLPNLKNDDGTRPADLALIFASLQSRRMPLTIIMLDEDGGEGPIGDFEILGGEKSEEDEDIQNIEVTAKPSVGGRRVEWYSAP